MGGFWPRIYIVKKGHAHARDIYFLLAADAQFLVRQRPLFSLYVLLSSIYSPVPFIGWRLAAVLALSHQASITDPVVLPI
jgi:hypothetical protein